MRRLAAVAGVLAVSATAAAGPLLPRVVQAALCNSPQVGSVSPQFGPAGTVVTVNGNGFTSLTGCKLQIQLGTATFTMNAPSSTQFSFTTSAGMSGQLQVTAIDGNGTPTGTDSRFIYITTPTVSSLDNSTPFTGATVKMVGSGFYLHLPSSWVQYAAAYTWSGGGGTCPGAPSAAPTFVDDTHLNVSMPTVYCDGNVAVTITVPTTTDTNPTLMSLPPLSAPFDIAPRVSTTPDAGTVGQTVTVGGTGFGLAGSVSVNGTAAAVSSWRDGSVAFVVPTNGTSGPVQLVRRYDHTGFGAGSLNITASIDSVTPASAAVGDTVTLSGGGFGPQQGSVTVGSTAATVQSWSPTSITFTVPADVTSGPINLSLTGNSPPASPPSLTVIPKITGITPAHAIAGALVEIDGTTFGTQQGTVQMGGQDAQVTLWGDKSVLAVVPSMRPGSAAVTLTPPGATTASFPFAVDPTPTARPLPSGSASPSSSAGAPAAGRPTPGLIPPNPSGPVIAHGYVPFTKPSPPPGPVSLKLDATQPRTAPGGSVDFTVTLMAFGKPIAGAPVDLLMVIEPGNDATVDPAHAITDANGQVHGIIHLSHTPGDHIVLARSGIYSDEIRVVGGSDTAITADTHAASVGTPPSNGPAILAVRSPVLWALVACLFLFGLGFGLNLVTSPAPGAAAAAATPAGHGLRATMGEGLAVLGGAARFAGAMVALTGARLLGALHRGSR